MSVIISDQPNSIEFLYSTGERKILDKDNLNIKEENNIFSKWVYISNSPGFVQTAENDVIRMRYSEVTSPALASNQELIDLILLYKASSGYTIGSVVITDGTRSVTLEPNGSLPVTLQDQHTPVVIVPFSLLEQQTTTSAPVAVNDYTVTLTSVVGVAAEKLITIFDPSAVRFAHFRAVGAPVGNVVTLDTPIPFAFPAGSYVDVGDINMAVDGSTTPVVFGIRNNAGAVPPPGLELSMDVTRVMTTGLCTSGVSLDLFGNLTRLTNGIVLRKRDGEIFNIFNVKANDGIAAIAFDFNVYASTNPQQGIDGFQSRLTFAGQSKMGVTVRLAIDEDLELIVQDDLTGLVSLTMIAEGSLVEP